MNILIVSQYFWPESFRINDIARSLAARGCGVDVLTGKPNYPEGAVFPGYAAWGCMREEWNGVSLFRAPLFPRGTKSAWRLAVNYLSFVLSGLVSGPWMLRRRKYDIVLVCGLSPIILAIPAIFIAAIKRRKLVLWVQDLWPDSLSATGYIRSPRVLRAVASVVRWIYGHSDLILVQSRAFMGPVAALAPGKPVVYYPNSVDPSFLKPPAAATPRPDIPPLDSGFPVLFAGNVGAAQGIEIVVDAAAILKDTPDIRFIVVGHGSRWEWIKEQAQRRGLSNLHLPGRFPVETMPGLMQKAGALLVSLTGDAIFTQTVPNKLQAYMASGKPILACLNGEGARLVAEAGAGFGIPAGDAKELANAILRLYRMKAEEREKMGANGRRYFLEHFDHEKLIDELIGHLQNSADGSKETA